MPSLATCTCAKANDTHLPSLDALGRCRECGKLLAARTVVTANAIQTEASPPKYHEEDPPFDDVRLSIRRKRRVHPAILGVVAAALSIGFIICVAHFFLLGAMISDQRDLAKTQVKGPLTNACQAYYLKHQMQFPVNLQVLLQKDDFGGPYLENPDALIDPWGTPYHYDIKGPRNMGTKPDIWAIAPDGALIGNWPR